MTVYELIKELTKYPANTEVYFKASGYVGDYLENMKEQGAVEDSDSFTVDGTTTGVDDWYDHPEIQCNIIY